MNEKKHIEEVKARIARRKKQLQMGYKNSYAACNKEEKIELALELPEGEEKERNREKNNVQDIATNKNGHIFRFVIALFLVASVTVIYRLPYDAFVPTRQFIGQVFQTEFPFAKNSAWVSEKLGNLYVLTPWRDFLAKEEQGGVDSIPVSGKVRESFQKNGRGIVIETSLKQKVRAIEAGVVIFAGEDNKLGNTVVVQQENGLNVWYGQLSELEVRLYAHVKKGDNVGQAVSNSEGDHGRYYFAIEKENEFVDPMQVIFFE